MDTAAKGLMGVLLAAATPMNGNPEVWAQWGLAGIVVAYVLWRDYDRERRLGRALDAEQKWIREQLVGALERNTAALERLEGTHDR